MKAIIIAGGLGTRLRPLTYNKPKPIVPVANKPFIIHQIEMLKRAGITEIILNLHYLSKAMEMILGDGSELGVKLYYSIERNPLGTAGAVKNAEKYFDSGPLIVLNGDILADFDVSRMIEFHKKNRSRATIALTKVDDPTPFGIVVTESGGRVKEFIEKPSWERVVTKNINAGLYILDPAIFKGIPRSKPYSFERELFPGLLAAGERVFGFVSDSYWIDIGSPQKYMQAHRDILNGDIKVSMNGYKKTKNVWIHADARVESKAKLRGPSMVGKDASIAGGATIGHYSVIGEKVAVKEGAFVDDSIILRNSKIGSGVKLKNCIIGENCIIEDEVEMIYGVVLGDYSIIKRGSRLV